MLSNNSSSLVSSSVVQGRLDTVLSWEGDDGVGEEGNGDPWLVSVGSEVALDFLAFVALGPVFFPLLGSGIAEVTCATGGRGDVGETGRPSDVSSSSSADPRRSRKSVEVSSICLGANGGVVRTEDGGEGSDPIVAEGDIAVGS